MKEMDVKKFVYLFIACNCCQDCFYLDLDYFKDYICNVFKLDYNEVVKDLKDTIDEMKNNNYVTIVYGFEYLMKINDSFPYQEIISENKFFLESIIMHVRDYSIYIFSTKKNIQDNGQVKVKK